MAITGVSLANFNNNNMVNFKGKKSENSQYENPISRSTERNLTILSSVGASALAGGIAGGLTTLCTKGKKCDGDKRESADTCGNVYGIF